MYVTQTDVEHFEHALRGQGLTPYGRQKIQGWEERVHESGANVDDVAELEKILKRAIVLRGIAGEDIHNSGRYGNGGHWSSVAWKPRVGRKTPASLLSDIQKSCVEHGHGELWNPIDYDTRDVVSIDIKVCYLASLQGMGEAKPSF